MDPLMKLMNRTILALMLFCSTATFAADKTVLQVLDIAPVWAGHPAGFVLLTHGGRQFAAYYAADRTLTVASRDLSSKTWTFTPLDEKVEWDSHNYITMAVDDGGFLHLSGNMHVNKLVYYRSEKPLDATTLVRVRSMTGKNEKRCTYPKFIRGPEGSFIFTYRDGSSGNGNQIYNVYDQNTRKWKRLLDNPLFDGQGKRNAYPSTPSLGPDGFYHLVWVWRESPDASSNHDIGHVRSRDLLHWETAAGKAVTLPITLSTSGVTVDPVPVKGGTINGSPKVSFDGMGRLVISYIKYDDAGKTQIYFARFEDDKWKRYQASDWDYRWEMNGGGSLGFEITHGALKACENRLTIDIKHKKYGSHTWEVDPLTMRLKAPLPEEAKTIPAQLNKVESDFPGMAVKWTRGEGKNNATPQVEYSLRWETLGPNRDRPRDKPWPKPSMLRLYEFTDHPEGKSNP